MIQTTAKKHILPADQYDLLLNLFQLEHETPATPSEVLKWNSAIRELRAKFQYQFGRA